MYLLKVLRLPHIILLLVGQVLSAIGDYFYTIAVMWIAVKTLGNDAGLVAAAGGIAAFSFGLLGGVYADRWNRRVTMIVVDLIRAVVVLILPVLALNGLLQFWHLMVTSFIIGAMGSLFNPALQASLLPLTGNDQGTLQATNALLDITSRLARALGPSLVGLLVTFLPLAHLFTLDAVSFGVSALSLLALGSHFAWQPERTEARSRGIHGVLREAGEGLRVVIKSQSLRATLISDLFSNFAWAISFIVGVPLLVEHGLGNGVGAYGLIVGAYGVGNVFGNLIVGSIRIKRRMFVLNLGNLILGVGFLLLAFAPNLPTALVAAFLASFGGPMSDITKSLMILELPSHQTGKVFGAFNTFERVLYSLGLLLAAPLFALVGVPVGMAVGALPLLVLSLYRLMGTEFRELYQRFSVKREAR
jgi:DHA3 family macrolide efflux protein-like MFS transporter